MINRNFPVHSVLAVLLAAAALAGLLPALARAQVSDPRYLAGTYLGGGGTDRGRNIGLDARGNIYLVGETFSSTFMGQTINRRGESDIFVAKLSPDARQLLGLFTIGGTRSDTVGGAAVTPQGEVVVAVSTDDPSFPTKNPLNPAIVQRNPGALLKVNAALNGLVFSTFTDFTVAPDLDNVGVDGAGNIIVAGYIYSPAPIARDMVLARFTPSGEQEFLRTFWDNTEVSEQPQGIAVLADGTTYITGFAQGWWGGLDVTEGAFQTVCGRRLALGQDRQCDDDAFVARVGPDGHLQYGTYLGGNGVDHGTGIAVDATGAAVVIGTTSALDFPTTAGAHQPRCRSSEPNAGCYYDMFVTRIAPDGSGLIYSTYLASGDESGLDYPGAVAVDAAGNATVTGTTASQLWPATNAVQSALAAFPCPNAFQDRLCFDAVVATFSPTGQLTFSSYLGGKGDEYGKTVALGADGSIYLAGITEAIDFPTTAGVVGATRRSGTEAFVARIGTPRGQAPGDGPPPSGSQTVKIHLPLMGR